MARGLIGQGIGERHANWPVFRPDEQIDVGNFIAIADQTFADKHD